MSCFTCISCGVAFPNGEIQRAHYKTDWHRYNLKRKVSELPPVTAENFRQRVLAHRPQLGGQEAEEQQESQSEYCSLCHKNFNNRNSYENHLRSRKHLEAVDSHDKLAQKDQQKHPNSENSVTENSTKQEPGLLKKDAKNMINKATLEINRSNTNVEGPSNRNIGRSVATNDEDESDDEGWEDVEGEALELEECLFCSLLSSSLEDNIKHMMEEHSFFVPDVEYVVDLPKLVAYLDEKVGVGNVCLWCNEKGKSFYSTKSAQQHMIDKGHCKLLHEGDVLEEYAEFYDYSQSYPDDGSDDDEVSQNVLDDKGFQLVLPSGSTVGHRSLMKYYRQNLKPVRQHPNRSMVQKVMSQYRALGWTGTTGEAAIRKARDLSLMHMKRSKHYMQLGVKSNKLQKYFRQQNPI